jgi:predicted nucleotidyltransferase
MRISAQQARMIREVAHEVAGRDARVWLFGSRLDDTARGGDIDLLLEMPNPVGNPALMSAQLAAQVSRRMEGRKVDVLLLAPNLKRLPIHEVALMEGQLL